MKFENILVVEDQEVANLSLRITLERLQLPHPLYAYYCDHALTMIMTALRENNPYDLLVTDLYFQVDGSVKQLPDGMALIKSVKSLQPDLKVLVFSSESRPGIIRRLYDEFQIDGFIRKARGDAQELKNAIEQVARNRRYYSREFRALSAQEHQHAFTEYDKMIISLLASGKGQKEISLWLEEHEVRPFGLSSIEKRLNLVRTSMGFTKNEQLIAFCKDMDLI